MEGVQNIVALILLPQEAAYGVLSFETISRSLLTFELCRFLSQELKIWL